MTDTAVIRTKHPPNMNLALVINSVSVMMFHFKEKETEARKFISPRLIIY